LCSLFAPGRWYAMPALIRADSMQLDLSVSNNLRVASLSIALYDYIYTLPAEWRFYKKQPSPFRFNIGFVLFVLIRYISILTLIISNVGFFSSSFTPQSCRHYYMAAPVLKVSQTMVSQAILGVRTYNISRRRRWVGVGILCGFFVVSVLEFFFNLYRRIPISNDGKCTAGNHDPSDQVAVWLFYVVAMVYDLSTLTVSTVYLIRYRPQSSAMSHLIRVMLYDGLGYFVALTGANILNLILYRASNPNVQTAAAPIGYAVTWIMSQRILIHLRDAGSDKSRTVVTHQLQSSRDINDAIQSQILGTHKGVGLEQGFSARVHGGDGPHGAVNSTELDVRVHIERSVIVNYNPSGGQESDRELYSSPKVMWDQRPPTS